MAVCARHVIALLVAAAGNMEADTMTISTDLGHYDVTLVDTDLVRCVLPRLGEGFARETNVQDVGNGWWRVLVSWDVPVSVQQDELSVEFQLLFDPDFWWAPHLAPREGDCIAQHVFRSPSLIAAEDEYTVVVVPALELVGQAPDNPWFMDTDAQNNNLVVGMCRARVYDHVLFEKEPGMTFGPGKVELGFYITAYMDGGEPRNPWRRVADFLWRRYARPLFESGAPCKSSLDAYVKHTYGWAFHNWKDAVWQQFEVDGKEVGAPAFIVNVTQSPNYPGEPGLREFLSIWNQAWFSSLRSASGVMRYALRTGNDNLKEKAELTKELALAAPMKDGLFPSVYRTEMEQVELEGERYSISKGWDTGYWCNSNRVPRERGITEDWYHLLDAGTTCYWMLMWHQDIESDDRLVEFASKYGDKLLELQRDDGFYPAWIHPQTGKPSEVLNESPETSMSVTFLFELAKVTGDDKYKASALKAMAAVIDNIIPEGRWEDFETYWSCCQWGKDEYAGEKIPRNGMYKQCSFSMFWTAQALLAAYRATGEQRYLEWGRRTLDELSMCQQVWKPPFIYVPALGGFGVMNCDGEWNDARQSLFAELFMEYYKETGDSALFERGIAALEAGFIMMYCPENPTVKAQWERVYEFFGPEDYGFMMENYGHCGKTSAEGEGMGTFTIYDWGNGAAAEARNRIRDHFGDVYIDRARQRGFGIDSVKVDYDDGEYILTDLTGELREIKVKFDNGESTAIDLDGSVSIK